jgi:hypothetical protein
VDPFTVSSTNPFKSAPNPFDRGWAGGSRHSSPDDADSVGAPSGGCGSEVGGWGGQENVPEKQRLDAEMLLGLDVAPRVGLQVQMAVGFFQAGKGTVTGVSADGGSVSVRWDSASHLTDRLLIGQDGVYALALAADGQSVQIEETTEASDEWDS